MKKSNEERLADIECSITRLTKMHDCVFKVLSIQHKVFKLFEKREEAFNSSVLTIESAQRRVDRSLIFAFGGLGAAGVVASISSASSGTKDFVDITLLAFFYILAAVSFFYGVSEYRGGRNKVQEMRMEFMRAGEFVQGARKEKMVLDNELAQVEAEWRELVPDDLVSEPKSED